MSTIKILRNDVFHALAGLNLQKAYGPDRVPPIILKNCASFCLSTSTLPSCWKFAYIQLVPKKGDCSDPSKYRPMSLMSYLSKIF
ncbi:hypothetical protein E2C01_039413 [Portunus trituberculatus]|uniref:Uncharacterized protein n=1 Tax=Portunus trituberculatus TaxID=210409 RepID=A0A5B7FJL6_PORTR|nr:hypothetical protein [Portunus trituberculatus]